MMRLIDAEFLFEKLDENSWYDNADRDIAEDLVLSAPAIVPESLRPREHWKKETVDGPDVVKYTSLLSAFCSRCGRRAWTKSTYCPHCGAKMED